MENYGHFLEREGGLEETILDKVDFGEVWVCSLRKQEMPVDASGKSQSPCCFTNCLHWGDNWRAEGNIWHVQRPLHEYPTHFMVRRDDYTQQPGHTLIDSLWGYRGGPVASQWQGTPSLAAYCGVKNGGYTGNMGGSSSPPSEEASGCWLPPS